ncbi:hypothetical protein JXA05_03325 [Candidatus Peregrinibacteria bacterium]|nr:hypothetical protein [Candidatus Peregrinibacteria bacterium]
MSKRKLIGTAIVLCVLFGMGVFYTWATWDPPGTQEEAAILAANRFCVVVQQSFMETLAVGKPADAYRAKIGRATEQAINAFEAILLEGRTAPWRLTDASHEEFSATKEIVIAFQERVRKDPSRKEMAAVMATHEFGALLEKYHHKALADLKEEIRNGP